MFTQRNNAATVTSSICGVEVIYRSWWWWWFKINAAATTYVCCFQDQYRFVYETLLEYTRGIDSRFPVSELASKIKERGIKDKKTKKNAYQMEYSVSQSSVWPPSFVRESLPLLLPDFATQVNLCCCCCPSVNLHEKFTKTSAWPLRSLGVWANKSLDHTIHPLHSSR